jgi:luciferase family oxidoreductase group 1
MIPLSILDLAPITQGSDAGESFRRTLDLAQHAEGWGYRRYWLAEHHGMPGIASAATAVLLAYVGSGTKTLRIGAGGVMLPNHAPLVIAEQFGTLESLFPGRVDLGLGRAPGSDQATARALRRTLESDPDAFPHDVVELMEYFAGAPQRVRAVPGAGLRVPIWILGSSLFGAELAAALGLPYAFASHFAPAYLMPALETYRRHFRPSAQLDRPYVMLGFNVYAAPTDEEAQYLATSHQQAFVNLRSGRPSTLPPPRADYLATLGPSERALLDQILACSAVGSPATVASKIAAFVARTGADELMLACQMYDHAARVRSYEIVAGLQAGAHVPTPGDA